MTTKPVYKKLEIKKQEIWSIAEVKNYLRISYDHDDVLIKSLIEAAVFAAEDFTGLSLYQRKVVAEISSVAKTLELKYSPIESVSSVMELENNAKRDITNSYGYVGVNNSAIHFGQEFIGKNIQIEYISGYAESIPRAISHGILMHIAAMYDRDGDSVLTNEVKSLYMPYRMLKI